jgi:hypothetical protein
MRCWTLAWLVDVAEFNSVGSNECAKATALLYDMMLDAMCVWKVFLVLKQCGRKASLTSVVSAKVEASGVAMRRKLRVLLCSIVPLALEIG